MKKTSLLIVNDQSIVREGLNQILGRSEEFEIASSTASSYQTKDLICSIFSVRLRSTKLLRRLRLLKRI
jgi:DNA-binding NarL/FixJ family response regulator